MLRVPRLTRTRLLAAGAVATSLTAGSVLLASGAVAQPITSGQSASAHSTSCTAKKTKITVKKVAKPYNHLLLTAKNTSKHNCDAFMAPLLLLGKGAQSATWVIDDSVPQAVVTLEPGEAAYASIIIAGSTPSKGDYTAHTVDVFFDGGQGQGSVAGHTHLKLPKGGVINANNAAVTYWQFSRKDALSW